MTTPRTASRAGSRAVAITSLAVSLQGQTFVVDANNGPGTDYTNLATAAQAVPDGSVLNVRSGFYAGPVQVVGKSLSILGEPGATVVASGPGVAIEVAALAANQSFAMHGMRVQGVLLQSQFTTVHAHDNVGQVLFQELQPVPGTGWIRLLSEHNQQVLVRDSEWWGDLRVLQGRCVLENCSLAAFDFGVEAIRVDGGDLQILGGTFEGGTNATTVTGPVARLGNAATVRVLEGTTLLVGPHRFGGASTTPLFVGLAPNPPFAPPFGSVCIDPTVPLVSPAGVAGTGITTSLVPLPSLRVGSAPLGGVMPLALAGATGSIGLCAASTPSVPGFPMPTTDAIWIDPVAPLQRFFAPLTTGAPILTNIPVLQCPDCSEPGSSSRG